MLDSFEILTTSGVVLWSRSFAPTNPSIINSLITNVFIEERNLPGAGVADDISAAHNPPYKHDQHTLKWTTVKELGLIFVVHCRLPPTATIRDTLANIDGIGCIQITSTPLMD
jgi:signal recognition particle receptor subunit alpha